MGSYGCNLKCDFCQNYHISQHVVGRHYQFAPEELVKPSLRAPDNTGIAFTYNEPVIWYEYVSTVPGLLHPKALKRDGDQRIYQQ